jgi:hypothetical protein
MRGVVTAGDLSRSISPRFELSSLRVAVVRHAVLRAETAFLRNSFTAVGMAEKARTVPDADA